MISGARARSHGEVAEEVEQFLDRGKGGKGGYMLALSAAGDLVGFRHWELHEGFYFTRELHVLRSARRRGVARALIHHFERWLLERGQTVACISCTPHNLAMIELARSEGYGILNTIEMRKNLNVDHCTPRGRADALGLVWEVL
jgi:GNAT superfamily N-acetyltransferase